MDKKYWILIVISSITIGLFLIYKKKSENFKSQNSFKITFKTDWGRSNLIGYPKNEPPHTGNFFLIQHDNNYNLFTVGDFASSGITESSMFGTNGSLIKEAKNYSYQTSDVLMTPGEKTFYIEYDPNNPYFSLATMIAPSADWFTGISKVDMRRINKKIKIPLYAYNAGTDYGDQFITFPKHPRGENTIPIFPITDGILFPNGKGDQIPFAYLIIEKI